MSAFACVQILAGTVGHDRPARAAPPSSRSETPVGQRTTAAWHTGKSSYGVAAPRV